MTSRRIMIVDDQSEVSHLLRSALDTLNQNIKIVEMRSGEEAILDATHKKVDLLVADYRLSGISGLKLMEKIRDLHPSVKVILMTGMSDPKIRKEVAQAGADAFFIKPIPIADFLDSVERILGLVETILPLEPILKDVKEQEPQGLAYQFSELRQKMKAQAVLLLNDRGRILACAGELPEKNQEVSLVASLMAIYNAAQKVTHIIGQLGNSSWHIFKGDINDLIFAPLDSTHAILMVGNKLAHEDVFLNNIGYFANARQAIEALLQELDGPIIPYIKDSSMDTDAEIEPDNSEEDLTPLLIKSKLKIKTDELDAFWSETAAGQPAVPLHADGLSYDQARQLGLTPEDEQV
ncbi:MAG: response regulator [Chloroflexota bacterium]